MTDEELLRAAEAVLSKWMLHVYNNSRAYKTTDRSDWVPLVKETLQTIEHMVERRS